MNEHPELRWLLDDETPSDRRRDAVRHARGCAGCRAGLAAADPSRLFALLGAEPVPEGFLDRLSSRVDAAIELEEAPAARAGFRWRWASLAASLLLAGAFGAYLWNDRSAVPSPSKLVEEPLAFQVEAEPSFELLSSPGTAQVVDLSVGGTRFVMIFDEDLDL